MLHAHIVAAMEKFLSATFIHEVANSGDFIRKLLETDPKIGEKKLTLKYIYKEHKKIETVADRNFSIAATICACNITKRSIFVGSSTTIFVKLIMLFK
jgi:hypothetical protein